MKKKIIILILVLICAFLIYLVAFSFIDLSKNIQYEYSQSYSQSKISTDKDNSNEEYLNGPNFQKLLNRLISNAKEYRNDSKMIPIIGFNDNYKSISSNLIQVNQEKNIDNYIYNLKNIRKEISLFNKYCIRYYYNNDGFIIGIFVARVKSTFFDPSKNIILVEEYYHLIDFSKLNKPISFSDLKSTIYSTIKLLDKESIMLFYDKEEVYPSIKYHDTYIKFNNIEQYNEELNSLLMDLKETENYILKPTFSSSEGSILKELVIEENL